MKNLAFVIWMIGWPLGLTFSRYLEYLTNQKYSQGVQDTASFVTLVMWVLFGFLLYEKSDSRKRDCMRVGRRRYDLD